MRSGIIMLIALLIPVLSVNPVFAISIEEIDTGSLDIPEIESLDFSETPIGSLESLLTYSERLIQAAEELISFIESIFDMFGMVNDPDVGNLISTLKDEIDNIGL